MSMANRKGISNVIATIILIAVAIALAVAVAIWAFGLFRGSAHSGTLNSISQ
ncbi:archaellin/type IV pilin N-terminal domain-containing protein, partial [Caldivirga sp. UBA161]|uniref:archaellin/type IV pilin N-terminal domain-containing protein n=1 Tax=Caldivirga sp. UBA161 TaxID=1915569 RepID=UPI0032E3A870